MAYNETPIERFVMNNLDALVKLNELEAQLNQVQSLIDAARAAFPADGKLQYRLDIEQQGVNTERKRIMQAKSLFISPN